MWPTSWANVPEPQSDPVTPKPPDSMSSPLGLECHPAQPQKE